MNLALYSYWRSTSSWRVRIALSYKGLTYDYRAVHLVRDEQAREEFRRLSPLGQVPTLVLSEGDRTESVTQSLAIIQRLELLKPEPRLIPADERTRIRAWELAEIVNAGIQPHQNLQNTRALSDHGIDVDAWVGRAIERGLAAYTQLVEESGPYSTGDTISVADVCLVPQLYAARRHGVNLSRFSRLVAIEQALESHPAFQTAHPSRQPDAPSESPPEGA